VFLLAVGHDPEIGTDAGVVEELIRKRYNRFKPVVIDDPLPDVARP
jgi:hypothetical protein